MIRTFAKVFLGLGILGATISPADETGKTELQPLREFRGERPEFDSSPIPEELILDEASYQVAWKALGLTESPGKVDFAQEALFLSTTRGSRIHLRLKDEGEGRLRVMAMATRDIRPGCRYVFGVFSKKEWKQINETLLP